MIRFFLVAGLLLGFSGSALAARPARKPHASVKVTSPDTRASSEEGYFSASLILGYGLGFDGVTEFQPPNTQEPLKWRANNGGPKPYGLMFGARAGYTFPFHLYLGSSFMYNVGSTNDLNERLPQQPQGIPTTSLTAKMFTVMAETGYDFQFGNFRLRPFVGLGIADVIVSWSNLGAAGFPLPDDSSAKIGLAIQPGAMFEYSFSSSGPGAFIGADMHVSIVTVSGAIGFANTITGGYRF